MRILLNDAFLDPENEKDNTHTVEYVNQVAAREGLNLEARIIKSRLGGIQKVHNKGVVVDGRRVLISSINWSLNSPLNNREAGVILDSMDAGAYFTDILTSATKST